MSALKPVRIPFLLSAHLLIVDCAANFCVRYAGYALPKFLRLAESNRDQFLVGSSPLPDTETTDENSLLQQHILPAVRKRDHQVHQYDHQIVMPAVCFLSPEPGVPGENFLLDCTQHQED